MTTLLLVLVAIAIIAGVAVLVVRDRPVLADDPAEAPATDWPVDGPADVTPEALTDVRFAVALRGYRMDAVDRVLDDASEALAQRDARIEELLRVVAALGGHAEEAPAEPMAEPAAAPESAELAAEPDETAPAEAPAR